MLKQSIKEEQKLQLNKAEFKAAGDRDLSNYGFNLEIEKGKVINDITGTAVARDLFKILREDLILKEFAIDKKIKINMGKSFEVKLKAALMEQIK